MSALPGARHRRLREEAAAAQFHRLPPQFLSPLIRASRGLLTAWRPTRGRRSGSGVYVIRTPRRFPHLVFGLEGRVKVMRTDAQHTAWLRISPARERRMARAPRLPDSDPAFRQVFWIHWRRRGPDGMATLVSSRFLGLVPFELVERALPPRDASAVHL